MAGETPEEQAKATPAAPAGTEQGDLPPVGMNVPERPQRPAFASGLPQREEVPTPGTIGAIRNLVRINLVAYLIPTALAATRQRELRNSLKDTLAAQSKGHSDTVIGRAVVLTLVFVIGLGLVFCILELLAAKSVRKRHIGGRTALTALTLIHLPVLLVVSAFRDGGGLDLIFTGVQAVLLVITLVTVLLPRTRYWLIARPPLAVRSMLVQQPATDRS